MLILIINMLEESLIIRYVDTLSEKTRLTYFQVRFNTFI